MILEDPSQYYPLFIFSSLEVSLSQEVSRPDFYKQSTALLSYLNSQLGTKINTSTGQSEEFILIFGLPNDAFLLFAFCIF